MISRLAIVVEGHGEIEAAPLLVRRIAQDLSPGRHLETLRPIRIHRGTLLKAGELENAVTFAANKAGVDGAVLVLLDSDDDCPADLGPRLYERARAARSDRPILIVLANKEFESWFIAAARSLQGLRGLSDQLCPPEDPEAIRGAKEWLSARKSGPYRETLDQPALAASMSLDEARAAPSFARFYRLVEQLLG